MQTNIAKDPKAVREVFTNIKTQLASAATSFEGPLKVLFDEVTGKLGGLLDGLPLGIKEGREAASKEAAAALAGEKLATERTTA